MVEVDLNTERLPLPWQTALWRGLAQRRAAGTLPHAMLLAGPAGVGKRRFARALSLTLLCEQPDPDGVACGDCRGCRFAAAGSHSDWRWLAPEERSKVIKIEQVRATIEFVAQTAQRSGRQVVVLEPVEALSRNAANALLKTLEEPSGEAVLLLISDAPGQLLPTLRSRCQRVDFPVPAPAESLAWLTPLAGDTATAEQALREADGRPMAARALLSEGALTARAERSQLLARLLAGEVSPIAAAQRWKDEELADLLGWLQARLLSGVRSALADSPATDAAVEGLARLPPEQLFALQEAVQQLLAQYQAGSNPNRQLALEALLLRLTTPSLS